MDDFFGENPVRPDHPDFWRISDIILTLDGRMQAAHSDESKNKVYTDAVAELVDMDSIVYMGMQRAFHALGVATKADLVEKAPQVSMLTTIWMEGFQVGSRFEKKGGKQ